MDFFVNSLEKNFITVIIAVLVALLVFVGLFFLMRLIVLWYFKINAMLAELKKMNSYLGRLVAQAEAPHAQPKPVIPVMPSEPVQPQPVIQPMPQAVPAMANMVSGKEAAVRICVKCGAPLQEGASFCMQCGTKNEI